MPLPSETSAEPESRLDEISTRWASISDPTQFVMRYSVAIERYLRRLIPNREDALDVMQSFLLRAVQQGFPEASADRGRFRFYLKTAVRHAALMHHRQRTSERRALESLSSELMQHSESHWDDSDQASKFDADWTSDWRTVLLDRVWDALLRSQRQHPESVVLAVLEAATKHPDETSSELAQRVTVATGREMTAGNFRVQLHRARREFARLIVHEVVETLTLPTVDAIESELLDTELLALVKPMLPDDWTSWPGIKL